MIASSQDSVYQGRVRLVQPLKGFRTGLDSLLLASALPAGASGEALEIGCGCGGALLPAAWRLDQLRFIGIENQADMADMARQGAGLNGFVPRVSIETAEASEWVRAHENRFDIVFSNPPYFEQGRTLPPGPGKEGAWLESLPLDEWIRAMLHAARPRAPVILIHRAAEIARILARLDRQAGEITILPIASRPDQPARRVLVRARKGLRRGPVTLLAPFVTHLPDASARTGQAEAVLQGAPLSW